MDELKPCPFCGCAMPSDGGHDEGCYFTALAALKSAPPADLSLAPAVLEAWNRRAPSGVMVGLSDERIAELWYGGKEPGHDVAPGYALAFARVIEAAHGIGVPPSDDWRQYAKDGETAQACIERHRREQDGLMKLLAHARGEPLSAEEIIALLPAGWTGMLAQVMEFARRIESARGVPPSDGGQRG